MAAYIPADAAFVVALDLPGLAATDLYKALEERGGTVGLNRLNFYKFAEMTGLNPTEDVQWLTFVGRAQSGGLDIDQLSALVSGTFDGAKTYAFLKDSGLPFTSSIVW